MRNFGILLSVLAMLAFGLQACNSGDDGGGDAGTGTATGTGTGTATE